MCMCSYCAECFNEVIRERLYQANINGHMSFSYNVIVFDTCKYLHFSL